MRKMVKRILVGFFLFMALGVFHSYCAQEHRQTDTPEDVVTNTWLGYKHYFIDKDGRVRRPMNDDTVSEGQAYAMLRAVWMNDKNTFDICYRWTEQNLSRSREKRDNLLAWQWKNGKVVDWMSASDADIDYALSLVFADSIWKGAAPKGLEDYGKKARSILNDILNLETFQVSTGKIYLSPWIVNKEKKSEVFPINPSYYSPAYFRIFLRYTNDIRWQALIDTTYYMLGSIAKGIAGVPGKGLIPDWCRVDNMDRFSPLGGKNMDFSWESVRVPLRVGLDFFWSRSPDSKGFFDSGFSSFIESQWSQNQKVYYKYDYSGKPKEKRENPIFYAAYYYALLATGSKDSPAMLNKTREYLIKTKEGWVYVSIRDYYANSLSWFADGLASGTIRDLSR